MSTDDSISIDYQTSLKVRVATFRDCDCSESEFSQTHLAIETGVTALRSIAGVAISYTWGEFDRKPCRLGHLFEHPSSIVSINLGAEWSASCFAQRLVQLSEKFGACWLDQICIPQKDEEIRKALVAIPVIYKTLPVVVLFPGSLCSCLRNAYDGYQAVKQQASNTASSVTEETYEATVSRLEAALESGECLNSNGMCSWTDRVWPLQELRYSTNITLSWASDETMDCCGSYGPSASFKKLGPYSRHLYQRLAAEHKLEHASIMRAIGNKSTIFGLKLATSAVGNRPTAGTPKEVKLELLAKFLLGETINLGNRDEKIAATHYLWQTLRGLAVAQRSATRASDYVLSIWVDWPVYIIPDNFLNMSAYELLSEALEQVHRCYTVFVPNTCPAGMMGLSSKTASWYVPRDDEKRSIRDARDLYGSFNWINGVAAPDIGCISLKVQDANSPSLGQQAIPLGAWTNGFDARTIVERFVAVTRHWHGSIHALLYESIEFSHTSEKFRLQLASNVASEQVRGLKGCLIHVLFPENDIEAWAPLLFNATADNVRDAAYELVCDILHVAPEACRKNGVKMILGRRSLGDDGGVKETNCNKTLCIGLAHWKSLNEAQISGNPGLTIALRDNPHRPFYEAIQVSNSASPNYAIIGVWIPLLQNLTIDEVGAVMTGGEGDAFVI